MHNNVSEVIKHYNYMLKNPRKKLALKTLIFKSLKKIEIIKEKKKSFSASVSLKNSVNSF